MNNDELNKKLEQLKIEDNVWIIYIGIIFLSWYANDLERKYYLYNDDNSKKKYRKLMILIFSILIVVYLYFFKDSYNELENLKLDDSVKKKKFIELSFVASLLIVISGFIFWYIAVMDEELNVELAFN